MVAPTVELAEYYTHVDSFVYMYAFNHHKLPDPAIYQARPTTFPGVPRRRPHRHQELAILPSVGTNP